MAMQSSTTQGAAGLSYGVGAAVSGLLVWGLSLCHVTVPAEQAGEVAFLVGIGVHYAFGPRPIPVATSAVPGITVAPKS